MEHFFNLERMKNEKFTANSINDIHGCNYSRVSKEFLNAEYVSFRTLKDVNEIGGLDINSVG